VTSLTSSFFLLPCYFSSFSKLFFPLGFFQAPCQILPTVVLSFFSASPLSVTCPTPLAPSRLWPTLLDRYLCRLELRRRFFFSRRKTTKRYWLFAFSSVLLGPVPLFRLSPQHTVHDVRRRQPSFAWCSYGRRLFVWRSSSLLFFFLCGHHLRRLIFPPTMF